MGFFQLGIFWGARLKPFRENLRFNRILFWSVATSCIVAVPLLAGVYWVHQADLVKLQNPMIGDHWNSKALQAWNFGTLELRLSFGYWKSLFISNMNDILGYLGIPAVLILGYSFFKSSGNQNARIFFIFLCFFCVADNFRKSLFCP